MDCFISNCLNIGLRRWFKTEKKKEGPSIKGARSMPTPTQLQLLWEGLELIEWYK